MSETAYVIGLPGNNISEGYLQLSIPQITRCLGYKPILFHGFTPDNLPSTLVFDKIKPTPNTPWEREFNPERKAIWYSHFYLWNRIVEQQEASWIFEHDANLEHVSVLIPYLGKDFVFGNKRGSLECYYLTPKGAQELTSIALAQRICQLTDTFVAWYVLERYKELNLRITQYLHLGVTSNDIHDARFRKLGDVRTAVEDE